MSAAPARLVMATNNMHKLDEMRALLEAVNAPVAVLSLNDFPAYPEPAETSLTFEGNALIKATECARRTGLPALADDSGLEVDALNGCPGVLSARWSGGHGDDAKNRALLLSQLSAVPAEQRTARFVCAMTLVVPDDKGDAAFAKSLRKVWHGTIATEQTTTDGFGYDPLFIADDAPEVNGQRLSSSQMSSIQKNARSHRGQALRAMLPVITEALHTNPSV